MGNDVFAFFCLRPGNFFDIYMYVANVQDSPFFQRAIIPKGWFQRGSKGH